MLHCGVTCATKQMKLEKTSVKMFVRVFIIAIITIFSQSSLALSQTSTEQSPVSSSPSKGVDSQYRLGSGDKIRLIVFGEDSLSNVFSVNGDGKVSLPLIGEVQAQGLTVTELQSAIEARLANGYLLNPRATVEVLNFRPFYILGEVNKPGEYPYNDGLTVLNAVAMAGGYTYRANNRKMFLRRANETNEKRLDMDPTLQVGPGDTIRIGERYF
jgi:protein involved in polysaccharide export with SLBB domain